MKSYRYGLLAALLSLFVAGPSPAQNAASPGYVVRKSVSAEAAKRIVAAAEDEAIKRRLKIAIAVVDDAGRLVHLLRMDGASNSTVDVAIRKAMHAANYRRDTAFHQDLLEKGNTVVLGLPDSLPIAGGLMLKSGEEMIGAVGVSGAASTVDAEIVRAAIASAGLAG